MIHWEKTVSRKFQLPTMLVIKLIELIAVLVVKHNYTSHISQET